jgi:kynurenine formamidase
MQYMESSGRWNILCKENRTHKEKEGFRTPGNQRVSLWHAICFYGDIKHVFNTIEREVVVMKIVDISMVLEEDLPSDPEVQIPHIQRRTHQDTAPEMKNYFPGSTIDDLPGGNGWSIDFAQLCTHSGTHLDAPWHYYPTMNGGERAWTIDEVPLEWCIGNGVKVDFHDKPDGYRIMAKDFEEYFTKVGYQLKEGDILLLQTGADKRWGTKEYLTAGCGVSKEATLWMIDQGVHVCGTDGWSWDVPLPYEAKMFQETGDASVLWEGHRAGAEKAYCHMEKLTNLAALPLTGYTVCCFPIKVKGASAGWTRAVAIFDD